MPVSARRAVAPSLRFAPFAYALLPVGPPLGVSLMLFRITRVAGGTERRSRAPRLSPARIPFERQFKSRSKFRPRTRASCYRSRSTIPKSLLPVEPPKFPQSRAAAWFAGIPPLTVSYLYIKTHIPPSLFDQPEHIFRRSHESATRGDRHLPTARLAHPSDGAQRHARRRQTEPVPTRDQRRAASAARHHGRPASRARQIRHGADRVRAAPARTRAKCTARNRTH